MPTLCYPLAYPGLVDLLCTFLDDVTASFNGEATKQEITLVREGLLPTLTGYYRRHYVKDLQNSNGPGGGRAECTGALQFSLPECTLSKKLKAQEDAQMPMDELQEPLSELRDALCAATGEPLQHKPRSDMTASDVTVYDDRTAEERVCLNSWKTSAERRCTIVTSPTLTD